MRKNGSNKWRWLAACSLLLVLLSFSGYTLPIAEQEKRDNIIELQRLRDLLKASQSLREADAVVVLDESTVNKAAQQLTGLEISLANGATLRLEAITVELQNAVALVKLGVNARAANAPMGLRLHLIGQLGVAEAAGDAPLRLPLQLTDVSFGNAVLSPVLRVLFGEWLSPQKWNAALPPLELPRELGEDVAIPAGRFAVDGELPMEVATAAYQLPLRFVISALFALDKRAVIVLREAGAAAPVAVAGANDATKTLADEVTQLSAPLAADGDLRLRLHRRVLSNLLARIASARETDLDIKLKPARVRQEVFDTPFRVTNYTDVESGAGGADLKQLTIERISNGLLDVRLNVAGAVNAQLRGREFGVPYRLVPRSDFLITDQLAPLRVVAEGERFGLRAVEGAALPVTIKLSVNVAGRPLSVTRQINLLAGRLFNRFTLPDFFARELPLPRRLEAKPEGGVNLTESRKLAVQATKLRVKAEAEVIEMAADVSFSPR